MIDEGELVVTVQAHADLLAERDRLRDLLREAEKALEAYRRPAGPPHPLLARIREAIGEGK